MGAVPTDSPTTIDVHAHALSPRLVELTADHPGSGRVGPRPVLDEDVADARLLEESLVLVVERLHLLGRDRAGTELGLQLGDLGRRTNDFLAVRA